MINVTSAIMFSLYKEVKHKRGSDLITNFFKRVSILKLACQ